MKEIENKNIKPAILTSDDQTIYPTGHEWILAFALKGCKWAIRIIESGEFEDSINKLYITENI